MALTYMTHKIHGAAHAGDSGEIDSMQKRGWVISKEPTAEEIRESKKGAIKARLEAELKALDAPVAVTVAPTKRGPKAKAAA